MDTFVVKRIFVYGEVRYITKWLCWRFLYGKLFI